MMQRTNAEQPAHPTISAHRVEGTAVYNLDGEWIGKIEDVIIEKVGGRVVSAIMAYGAGPLSAGGGRYPIPWECLSYDPSHKGYRVDEERLKTAPSVGSLEESRNDLPWREGVYAHWAAPPYWYGSRPHPRAGRR